MPLVGSVRDDIEPAELEFRFGNGGLALDLVATVGERWSRSFERLRAPADLLRWLEAEGMIVRAKLTADDLAQFTRLRSAIFDLVDARRQRRPPPAGPLRVVNSAADVQSPSPRLTRGWEREFDPHGRSPVQVALAAIAGDAIALLAEVDPDRIRECAADDCSRLFADRSRPGRRRWCDSTGCGNRAKTAAYRQRRKRR